MVVKTKHLFRSTLGIRTIGTGNHRYERDGRGGGESPKFASVHHTAGCNSQKSELGGGGGWPRQAIAKKEYWVSRVPDGPLMIIQQKSER